MTKKLLTFLFLILGATLPALSSAQEEAHSDIPPAVIETLAEEPPLGQADLEAYIKIIPELPKLLSDPQSAEQLAAGLNLSPIRFSYIVVKVPLVMALASGVDPKSLGLDSLPQSLRPSDSELSLVKDNLETLIEAAEKANRAFEAWPGVTAK
ncbi:MAG: hypothetical protein LBC90_05645 [Candidatus Adiutrix sp.]|jgi:hypothetical protein|nr:hypothetical protein [Candidatus Adiutrix sp.]